MEKHCEGGAAADPASGSDNSSSSSTLTVQVKFGGRSIPVPVPAEASVRELKSLLQPLTNVIPRGQKLIFKGIYMQIRSFLFCLINKNVLLSIIANWFTPQERF